MARNILPETCPSCGQVLSVKRLACGECETAVEGDFRLPLLARLRHEEQAFVLNLLKSRGSLKDLARVYGVSYPTVRNRLDALIDRVAELEARAMPLPESKKVAQERHEALAQTEGEESQ
jgi:hypothetical protein